MSRNRRQHPKKGSTTIQTRTIEDVTYKIVSEAKIYSIEIWCGGIRKKVFAPYFRVEDALKNCKSLMNEQVAAE
jgi:hypothetical protein